MLHQRKGNTRTFHGRQTEFKPRKGTWGLVILSVEAQEAQELNQLCQVRGGVGCCLLKSLKKLLNNDSDHAITIKLTFWAGRAWYGEPRMMLTYSEPWKVYKVPSPRYQFSHAVYLGHWCSEGPKNMLPCRGGLTFILTLLAVLPLDLSHFLAPPLCRSVPPSTAIKWLSSWGEGGERQRARETSAWWAGQCRGVGNLRR